MVERRLDLERTLMSFLTASKPLTSILIIAICSSIFAISDGSGMTPPPPQPEAFPNVSVSVEPSDEPDCCYLVFKGDESISVDHGVGSVELTGSISVCPENSTTYTITVSRGNFTTKDSIPVNIDNVTADLGRLPTVIKSDFSISNVEDGDRVPQILTLMGTCPPDLKEDIWIFVISPNGLYYPQSPDACNISWRTPNVNGRWETRVGFGQPEEVGAYFGLVLTVADREASENISDSLKEWCDSGVYTGWKRLPPGVTEVQRITVVRNPDIFAPAPNISDTRLRGDVSFANISENDTVPFHMDIDGNCTNDLDGDIWVLVYPTNARWYPQSINPGVVDTFKAGGTWRTTGYFGGKESNFGEPFDVVVVLANGTASRTFSEKQRAWSETETPNYPGLLTIELPPGIEEKDRVRVYRR
jgi:hypothetical protein